MHGFQFFPLVFLETIGNRYRREIEVWISGWNSMLAFEVLQWTRPF